MKPADRERDYPPRMRKSYRLAMEGRSRRLAIRCFCVMCMGYEIGEVAACTDPACPLFPYRRGQPTWKRKPKETEAQP